ncbi:nucleoside 2-deoxyribosyltransferase [Patescibacteria group bacterium]
MKKRDKRIVYFVASLVGKEEYGVYYKQIAKVFSDLGYEVWDDVNHISPDEARLYTKKQIINYFSDVQKRIKKADIFVAEESQPSTSIGYEIGYAVGNNIPSLVLRLDHLSAPGAPFRGNQAKILSYMRYNKKNLRKKVEQFLRKAQKGIFVKRLPIEFTQEQVDYVEYRQISTTRKKSFNACIREIIEESMSKDKKYSEAKELL